MVSCFWYSVARENAVALAWKEMEGYWKCEVGYGCRNSYMEMYGVSCEGWVVVNLESRERVGGDFEVSG